MSAPKNRFGGILDATRARQAEQPAQADEPEREPAPAPPKPPAKTKPIQAKKSGGKSSNPDYRHISAYIRRTTHTAAHKKLLDEGGQRDLSDVINELLDQWAANG